jgi:orotidine-5'-phosphate decarboxylase
MSAGSFAERWARLAAERGHLCVGIGMTTPVVRSWHLPAGVPGLRALAARVLDAMGDRVAAVKVHAGFFERFGADGLAVMRDLVRGVHASGTLAIVDAKRGEAADLSAALADLYLGPHSAVGADALVVHPYLGFAALDPLFTAAATCGAHVFVLARTSNDGGAEIQTARLPDGRSVAEFVVDAVRAANARTAAAGLVVGAPAAEARALYERAGDALVSLPGLGRPGRTTEEFRGIVAGDPGRAILPITSGVLAAGPDRAALAQAIGSWLDALSAPALSVAA